MEDLIAIQGKTIAELREIAKVLGIKGEKLTKKEIIAQISALGNADENQSEVATEQVGDDAKEAQVVEQAPASPKRKRARLSSVQVKPVQKAETQESESTIVENTTATTEIAEVKVEITEETKAESGNTEAEVAQPKKRGRKPKKAVAEESAPTAERL